MKWVFTTILGIAGLAATLFTTVAAHWLNHSSRFQAYLNELAEKWWPPIEPSLDRDGADRTDPMAYRFTMICMVVAIGFSEAQAYEVGGLFDGDPHASEITSEADGRRRKTTNRRRADRVHCVVTELEPKN